MIEIESLSGDYAPALAELQRLLRNYAAHVRGTAGKDHICLSSFEDELCELPSRYSLLLLARVDADAAGCVLLKTIAVSSGERAAEMKRLWVEPAFRSRGVGKLLAEELLRRARSLGYPSLYLDTIPGEMPAAVALYRKLGFEETPRYNTNTLTGVQFFCLTFLR